MAGYNEYRERVISSLRRGFQVGSEDKNDSMFVGQCIRWIVDCKPGPHIRVGQDLCIDERAEIPLGKESLTKI